jgi:hypothetical protein
VPYPANGLSLALGNSGGGNLDTAATGSAYIVLFAANQPVAGGLAGDIYMGNTLTLGHNTSGGATITTLDGDALTIDTSTTGTISISTGTTGKTISIGTNASAANTIAIGSSNASATLALTGGPNWSISTAGLAVLGVAGGSPSNFTFNPASGPVYTGTARPTKRITLTPEYAGATIMGIGGSNTGTMTSDNENASPYHNFYKWANTQGTAQNYDIFVRVPIPADFSAMPASNPLYIETYSNSVATGTVTVSVYDTSNASDCSAVAYTPTSPSGWETKNDTTCLNGTYAANGVMTIDIKLTAAASTGVTQVSNIYFDYLAKF